MHRYIDVLKKNDLFTGICTENIGKILDYFDARLRVFDDGDYIFKSNNELNRIAVFIDGKAQIINEDFLGNATTLSQVGNGDIFGEVHSLLPYDTPTVSVVALCRTTVIFIDIDCILTPIQDISDCQSQLRSNLMRIMARKLLNNARKLEHISRRSTRQKLLSYFTEQMNTHHSPAFDIPFSRQQLADYLAVDRSAMSSELSKMQRDGLIHYNLNHFELIPEDECVSYFFLFVSLRISQENTANGSHYPLIPFCC